MKVFLQVSVDVGTDDGQPRDVTAVRAAVQEAVLNALELVQIVGFVHAMSDDLSIIVDRVDVKDVDFIDKWS